MSKWMVAAKKADFNTIAEKYHITPMLARIIRNRDVIGENQIRRFLVGTEKDLYHPMLMKDMGKAVDVILEKIIEGKKIRIIGDYDIDGVCSTYILYKGLISCGADVDTAIPHRMKDGYGLNESLIQEAYDAGIDTIITCDNGIAAYEQIAFANQLGMTVVITDHHEVPYEEKDGKRAYRIPPAAAVVDPKQEDCKYPFPSICGGMVAYKYVLVLKKAQNKLRQKGIVLESREEVTAWSKEEIALAKDAVKTVIKEMEPKSGLENEIESFGTVESLDSTEYLSVMRSELGLELMEFAAFSTIGDVMELLDENRIVVKLGLRLMQHTRNTGLKALMDATEVDVQHMKQHTIGFILGPCMNATGRLDTAARALALLQENDRAKAAIIASDLKSMNDSRKDMTAEGVDLSIKMIEESSLKQDRVLVVYLPDIHESLAGIIAGRIREKYGKPTFVLTKGEEGVKGSGRSIDTYHMYDEMSKCKELFTKYGGHKLAAGLSLEEENVTVFRERINELCTLTEADFDPSILIDVPMPMCYANMDFTKELDQLEPFGMGNPKPLFAQKNVYFLKGRKLGKNANVGKYQAADDQGQVYEIIYFGDLEQFDQYVAWKTDERTMERLYGSGLQKQLALSVAYYPEINEFRGNESLQMVMKYYQ